MDKQIKTGGNWNPNEEMIYFIASNVDTMGHVTQVNKNLLIAVNELRNEEHLERVAEWCAGGHSVFIDSGVFNLTNQHARKHNVSMDDALALAPEEISGFDKLFEDYCKVVTKLKDHCWGYIEIDQGGRDNKIRTRENLESLGFNPIPVYHPLNDGWDYFDELASKYDRICFGNIVQADRTTRKRLLATAWERRRKYPNLWIHLLGYTANEMLNALPVNSCDSSTWLAGVRWPEAFVTRAALKSVAHLGAEFAYNFDIDKNDAGGWSDALRLGAFEASMLTRQWRLIANDYKTLGADIGLYL